MARTDRTITTAPTGELHEVVDTPQDSLELSVNAKGEPTWCVKVYGRDATDIAPRLDELRKLAEKHAADVRTGKGA